MTEFVMVFGSNEAGRHGKGAAKRAFERYGAQYGVGEGHVGNSYAIPTKDGKLNTLPLGRIEQYVNNFKYYAEQRPECTFHVTQVGCGLAGYFPDEIAPLFKNSPKNCVFDTQWASFLGDGYDYHSGQC